MSALRLAWSRTWPDKPRDFSCRTHDGQQVGRIYQSSGTGTRAEAWFWCLNGTIGNRLTSGAGFAATKDEAAEAVERAWFAADSRAES